MTHDCPAAGCTREIRYEMLMCRFHWHMVPQAIRTAVWNAWQDGAGAGTAQQAAIRSVNEKLAAAGPAPAGPPPCRADPDDCPNGPGPHAYYNPPEFDGRMCCCRQPGEDEDQEPAI